LVINGFLTNPTPDNFKLVVEFLYLFEPENLSADHFFFLLTGHPALEKDSFLSRNTEFKFAL
jgi:hypothetical protein